jgi:hypothetical protein
MSDKRPMKMPQLTDRPGWTEMSELDPDTGVFRQKYFFRGVPAQRIPITSKIARRLAGYTLIERDLRAVHGWLEQIFELSKSQLAQEKEGWHFTDKPDPENSLTSALFIASVTSYAKCFTKAEGRNVKLETQDVVPAELREVHDLVMSFRNNFAAHSGNAKYEAAQIVLVLNPMIREGEGSKYLLRESLQPESYLRYDPIESFSTLVERVREHVLEKTAHLNQKIFTEEINPKGSDYWYAQKLY